MQKARSVSGFSLAPARVKGINAYTNEQIGIFLKAAVGSGCGF